MSQTNAGRRLSTQTRETGRYLPRRFNPVTRERFLRDRRRRILRRIAGRPSDEQSALAQTVARLEWAALAAEAEGGLHALREAREHRRLLQKLLVDFERTLRVVAAPSTPSLAEYLATKTEGAAA
jgi:hypothetical protein